MTGTSQFIDRSRSVARPLMGRTHQGLSHASILISGTVGHLAASRYYRWGLLASHSRNNICVAIMSDRDLIRGSRNGDVGAWQGLLERYERLVFSVPRRYGLSREDAADITQLTFTILVQSIDTLPEDSSLGAWLVTVARRHTWRMLERKRRHDEAGEYGSSSKGLTPLSTSSTEDLEHWERAEWLNHGLTNVSKACRDLLSALYLEPEQPSYAEVAARLGMAVGSVGPTRIRCLKRLKEVLSE
jgi:RNA polymerase sigma factor (sigma-70 family)